MTFVDVLTEKNLVTPEQVGVISDEAAKTGKSIESILLSRGVSATDILVAKGDYFSIPTRKLDKHTVSFEVLQYIPEESAKHYHFVPIGVVDNVLEVGVVDPDNIEARDALQFISTKTKMPFKTYLILEEDYQKILENYKSLSGEVTKALTDLETELSIEEQELSETIADAKKIKLGQKAAIIEDAPVTKIVATILRFAIEQKASDVHIEPMESRVRVRFRIDGLLRTNLELPAKVLSAVVARIKILSKMRLDEKRKPQDNRFSAHIEGRKIDFRVSTFPTYYGEKVVMRILDSEKGVYKLNEMGISPKNLKAIRASIKRPYGLILISGPTGSGKTSTLYAMLSEVDKETKNVLSLEDPVEYNVSGMNQSQVRPEIGYTFATGLRTTLRQDPDIIMVGEIRDKETAELAIQAALTGHLVLSTIHTNNALGVIPRLVDMGVDPYLIAPTLVLAIAQRLVRKICPDSGVKVPVEGSLKLMLEKQFSDLPEKFRNEINMPEFVLEAEKTANCPDGTKGRQAVFEILEMDKDLERVILEDPTEATIMKMAREKGMLTMKEDAIIKAFEHKIPFTEVNTVGVLIETGSEDKAETKIEEVKPDVLE